LGHDLLLRYAQDLLEGTGEPVEWRFWLGLLLGWHEGFLAVGNRIVPEQELERKRSSSDLSDTLLGLDAVQEPLDRHLDLVELPIRDVQEWDVVVATPFPLESVVVE
jgi:hypothetical protein